MKETKEKEEGENSSYVNLQHSAAESCRKRQFSF